MGVHECKDLKTVIPALPGVMRKHGWMVAAKLLQRWIDSPYASTTDILAPDTTTVDVFEF